MPGYDGRRSRCRRGMCRRRLECDRHLLRVRRHRRPASSASNPRVVQPSVAGVPGVVHGMRSYLMQDEYGQVEEAKSISAGLDYPGRRAGARVPGVDRARRVPERHRRRGGRGVPNAVANGGDHSGARARTRWRGWSREAPLAGRRGRSLVNLSGRGDKDVAQMMDITRPDAVALDGGVPRQARRRPQAPRAVHHRRLPGLAGRDPCRRRDGADAIEIGMPFSDPVMDGPGDPAGVAGRARRRRDAVRRSSTRFRSSTCRSR